MQPKRGAGHWVLENHARNRLIAARVREGTGGDLKLFFRHARARKPRIGSHGPGINGKARVFRPGFYFNSGNFLLSHTLARAVPSGLQGLTAVFGMGTGGTPALQSP